MSGECTEPWTAAVAELNDTELTLDSDGRSVIVG